MQIARRAVPVGLAVLLALGAGPGPATSQTTLTLTPGTALYSSDEFCLDSGAFITNFDAGVEGSVFGVEASYIGDWPWPPRGGGGGGGGAAQAFYATHGDAFAATVKLFPLSGIGRLGARESLGSIDSFLRPFVGLGVMTSTDGEPANDRDLPTYGVRGQTHPLLSLGASVEVPPRATPLGVIITYRYNIAFSRDFELDTGTGRDLVVSGDNLKWGVISVGLRIGLGQ